MGRPRDQLPKDLDDKIEELVQLERLAERLEQELDDELYRLVDELGYSVSALARATGANKHTLQKRVARIRKARAAVQSQRKAA